MCGPNCPGKPNVKNIKVGGQSIGVSGYEEIMSRGLAHLGDSDDEQKQVLLDELKKHNYVPPAMEREYLDAIWAEFKTLRAKKMGWLEDSYHGIPREEIAWFPRVDLEKCIGCKTCVEFCMHKVYTFDGKARVTNPYRCVVTCTGCKGKCEEGAISFPTLVDLREELNKLRKKHSLSKE